MRPRKNYFEHEKLFFGYQRKKAMLGHSLFLLEKLRRLFRKLSYANSLRPAF